MVRLFSLIALYLVGGFAAAHPPGMIDDQTLRCGKNQLESQVEEVCLAEVFRGSHANGEAMISVLIHKMKDKSTAVFPVLSNEGGTLQILFREADLGSFIKMVDTRSFDVRRDDQGAIKSLESFREPLVKAELAN